MSDLIKLSFIRKMPNGKYRVVSRKGKNLGEYSTKEEAKKRLRQIEFFKHKKASDDTIDLTDIDSYSLSAIMRKLNKEGSNDLSLKFLKMYKDHFDKLILAGTQEPEKHALNKALIDLNKEVDVKLDKHMVKEAAIAEIGNAEEVGAYLASMIKFLLKNISWENRAKSQNNLRNKIYYLKETDLSNKKMPASASLGQAITLVKHMMFGHSPSYIREVLNNIVRSL